MPEGTERKTENLEYSTPTVSLYFAMDGMTGEAVEVVGWRGDEAYRLRPIEVHIWTAEPLY